MENKTKAEMEVAEMKPDDNEMKPDNKSPYEMLSDIGDYAVKARDAANDLAVAVAEMRRDFPWEDWYHEARWWQSVAEGFASDADCIRDRIEEIFDKFYVAGGGEG